MKRINAVCCYLLSVHLLVLACMFVVRSLLLFHNWHYVSEPETPRGWITQALLHGLWFDNVVACYIAALPLILMPLFAFFRRKKSLYYTAFNPYFTILYTLVFALLIANIPYFDYFFKPLNTSIFNWQAEAWMNTRMLFQERSYLLYILLFVALSVLFGVAIRRIARLCFTKPSLTECRRWDYVIYPPLYVLFLALCLLGIRGRFGYNPIRTSQAYFCTNSFLNQLGINPVFYFARDVLETSQTHYMIDKLVSEQEAISYAKADLGVSATQPAGSFAREITAEGEPENLNVVLILMESMSADFLDVKAKGRELTPYLNQLIAKSYYFENIYSAGIHTNHGVLASLYGMPVLLDRNMLKNVNIPLFRGLPSILREQGYHTMFFVPHEGQYDNIGAFVSENGIETLYSEESYPASKRVNCWGVADDYLFEFALQTFNEKAGEGSPFFATILTVSNHPPYVVPKAFMPVSDDPQQQIVAFADDAIRQFMTAAAREAWFEHTLFVLLGDHGKMVGTQLYDMPLSYNHIPLIIYSPRLEDAPRRFTQFGGQIDVFPTIMGLLKHPYTNNTLGMDLLKEQRSRMYFSADDAIACIDPDFFYFYNVKAEQEHLYKYRENSLHNLATQEQSRTDSMRTHSASMLQTANYLFKRSRIQK